MFSNLRIFRDPIKPLWEVPQNRDGGKFVLILNKPEATHKDSAAPSETERNDKESDESKDGACEDAGHDGDVSPREEHTDASSTGPHGHGKEKPSVDVPLEYKLCLALMVLGLLGPVEQFCGCVLSIRAFGHMISIWVSSATVDDDTVIQDIRHNIATLLGFPLEQISFQRHNESIRNNTRNLSKTETRKRMREARAKGDVVEPQQKPPRRKSESEKSDETAAPAPTLPPTSPRGKNTAAAAPRRPSASKEKVHFQENVEIAPARQPPARAHPTTPLVIPDITIVSGTPPTRQLAPIHALAGTGAPEVAVFSYAAVAAGAAHSTSTTSSEEVSPRKDEGGWRHRGARNSLERAIPPQQQQAPRRNEPFTTKKRRAQSASAGQKPDPNYVSPEALFGADLPLLSPTTTPHPSVPPSPPSEASDDLLGVSAQERAARNRARHVAQALNSIEPETSHSSLSAASTSSSSSATTSTISPRSHPGSTGASGRYTSVSVGATATPTRPAATSEPGLSSSPPDTSSSARRRNRGRRRKSTTDTGDTYPYTATEDGGEHTSSQLVVPVAPDH